MRDITLNYKASQLENFDTIKNLDLNGRSNSTVTFPRDKNIKGKRGDGASLSIVTKPRIKFIEYPF